MSGHKAGATKGPDNNKRLLALEASVSSLAIALVANGFEVPEGADPCEAAIVALKKLGGDHNDAIVQLSAMGEKVAKLEEAGTEEAKAQLEQFGVQLATIADHLLAHYPEKIDGSGSAPELAVQLLTEHREKIASLEEAIGNGGASDATAAFEDRIDELERTVMARESRIKELEAGAPVVIEQVAGDDEPESVEAPREREETARDVGPDVPGKFASAEIRSLIEGDGGELSIAFSNGSYEIVALAPVVIQPSDLQTFEGRNVVLPTVHARIENGGAAEELHGFGLMLNGEQIAYSALIDPINMKPGEEHAFTKAIFF